MNIVEVQEQLKDFSKNQLVQEMQRPSGVAPQFLVLSEINRRARMEQDYQARMAQDMPSVAQEAIAAAGVPQQGIAQMASAMNPKSQDGIGSFMKQSVPMNTGGVTKAQAGLPANVMGIKGVESSFGTNPDAFSTYKIFRWVGSNATNEIEE